MSNIIDKLGIKRIEQYQEDGLYYCLADEVIELEQQRNDLLEALILCYEDNEDRSGYYNTRKLIEKVTGKSWEKIKELFDD